MIVTLISIPKCRATAGAGLTAILLLSAGWCHAGPVEVYLLAGQSNMTAGLEAGFSQAIDKLNGDPTVQTARYTSSGTGLDAGWNGGIWLGDPAGAGRQNFYPGLNSSDANVGTAYMAMRNQFQAALTQLDNQNVDYQVKGFVWMQGEQDAKNGTSASRYAANLARLSNRLYEDLGLTGDPLPFVYGHVLPVSVAAGAQQGVDLSRFTHRDQLRQSQANADASSGHGDALSSASLVSTDGLDMIADLVHFTAAGQAALGERIAQKMHVAQQTPEPASGCLGLLGGGAVLCGFSRWVGHQGRSWPVKDERE